MLSIITFAFGVLLGWFARKYYPDLPKRFQNWRKNRGG